MLEKSTQRVGREFLAGGTRLSMVAGVVGTVVERGLQRPQIKFAHLK